MAGITCRQLIDCHAHIYAPYFSKPLLAGLLHEAAAAGVAGIVTVPETLAECQAVLELSRVEPLIRPCAGLHPVQAAADPPMHFGLRSRHPEPELQHVRHDPADMLEPAAASASSPLRAGVPELPERSQGAPAPRPPQQWEKRSARIDELPAVLEFCRRNADELVGIGEIGLDFSPHVLHVRKGSGRGNAQEEPGRERDEKDVQRHIFAEQVRLAMELGLPVNVHSRAAGHHAISVLRECAAPPGTVLLHAFDGRPTHALQAVQLGYYFSVAPSIVRSPALEKLVAALPLTSLVLETDSPALGPVKDEPNKPANVTLALREIARIKGFDEATVAQMTTENARKLFARLA